MSHGEKSFRLSMTLISKKGDVKCVLSKVKWVKFDTVVTIVIHTVGNTGLKEMVHYDVPHRLTA